METLNHINGVKSSSSLYQQGASDMLDKGKYLRKICVNGTKQSTKASIMAIITFTKVR